MSKYKLCIATDSQQWDSIVEKSPQGTIFSSSLYLDTVGRKYERFFVYKGNEIKAALCYIITDDERECELDDLVIYNGLMFKYNDRAKESSARIERFEIAKFVIGNLVERYGRIEMALNPHFEDLRPFLWHNYHSTNPNDKFKVDIRYTSYLDISEFAEQKVDVKMQLFKNMERLRRRRVKEAIKVEARMETSTKTGILIDFYKQLMESQNIVPEDEKLIRMKQLVKSLIENKQAILLYLQEREERASYGIVFCFDTKRGYALFAAGDPNVHSRYKGTFAYWEGWKYLAIHHNIKEVDLEGVNSPQRGWFKLSFGGNLIPYYQVHKGRNNNK